MLLIFSENIDLDNITVDENKYDELRVDGSNLKKHKKREKFKSNANTTKKRKNRNKKQKDCNSNSNSNDSESSVSSVIENGERYV